MLAAVVEISNEEVVVQDEVGRRHTVSKDSEDYELFKVFYITDSYFEFDSKEKKVILLDEKMDLEDYTLPEDFV